ncbi:hypothetical protein HYX04_00720 [Candidatus Woesearchaeota archaeon]|nr:hypothetical protein [Candidatus Woesearchaeota archaeon]
MSQKDRKRLLIVGFILVAIGAADFIFTVLFEPFYNLLWFSNAITLLLGLAIISMNRLFMGAMLISSAAEIPWVMDFISHIFLGKGIFGNVTEYMFMDFGLKSINFYMELDHLLVIPIALYGAYKIGVHKNSYLISSAHIILLNALTFYMAPASKNINCIFHLCPLKEDIFNLNDVAYLIIWTVLLCITAYLLNKSALKFFRQK